MLRIGQHLAAVLQNCSIICRVLVFGFVPSIGEVLAVSLIVKIWQQEMIMLCQCIILFLIKYITWKNKIRKEKEREQRESSYYVKNCLKNLTEEDTSYKELMKWMQKHFHTIQISTLSCSIDGINWGLNLEWWQCTKYTPCLFFTSSNEMSTIPPVFFKRENKYY